MHSSAHSSVTIGIYFIIAKISFTVLLISLTTSTSNNPYLSSIISILRLTLSFIFKFSEGTKPEKATLIDA